MLPKLFSTLFLTLILVTASSQKQKANTNSKTDGWKKEVLNAIDQKSKQAQEMVDMVFSFSELGFQETETSAYLTRILEQNGFTIERGISGIPTAWLAKWGSGKPFIALGSDIDCIPKASQKPGVAYHIPLIKGGAGTR